MVWPIRSLVIILILRERGLTRLGWDVRSMGTRQVDWLRAEVLLDKFSPLSFSIRMMYIYLFNSFFVLFCFVH